MFYKVRIDIYEYALVEANNIRTARNLAAERIIDVEKATELELVTAGRDGWPIISAESEKATDDGQESLPLPEPSEPAKHWTGVEMWPLLDKDEYSLGISDRTETRTLSTGSAPAWLPPMNPPATDTGD